MAWRDELRPASFRGVPFKVETSQLTTGRRVSVHEYPNRDIPYPEDLGKIGEGYPVTGYLIGADYIAQKKALKAAVDTQGPGELIHPYWGTLQVQCGPVSFDENKNDGGMVTVTFQFYEAGNNKFPDPLDNKVASLFDRTKKALAAAKSEFDSKFNVVKMAGYAVDRARQSVADAADLYQSAASTVAGVSQDIANLAYSVRNLKAQTNDLLTAPSKLSQRLFDSIALLEDAVGTSRGRLQAYSSLFTYGASDTLPEPTTPMRARDAENKKQFDNLQQRIGIVGAVNQIPDIEFESTEEAVKFRDQIIALIEKQLLETTDDEVYSAFQELQAQVVNILPDADSDLPNIQEILVPETTSSLIFCYDKFENLSSEEDIVIRNNIEHPGFIMAGTILEVVNV